MPFFSSAPFFFIPFLYDATAFELRVCDTLYWLCYPLIRERLVTDSSWVVFFFFCEMGHAFSAAFIIPAEYSYFPRASVYSLHIYYSVRFFFSVCECPQIHSPAGNHFSWFDIPILPLVFSQIDCRTNTLTAFNISTIIVDNLHGRQLQRFHVQFQLFIET